MHTTYVLFHGLVGIFLCMPIISMVCVLIHEGWLFLKDFYSGLFRGAVVRRQITHAEDKL